MCVRSKTSIIVEKECKNPAAERFFIYVFSVCVVVHPEALVRALLSSFCLSGVFVNPAIPFLFMGVIE